MTVSCAGLGFRIAVLIPCYNEAIAIPKVVADFRASLPDARIYVYDNDSSDGTIAAAREAGAVVRAERLQGKGHVVRRMFSDIEADIYVLVDGDDTYDAQAVPDKVNLLLQDHLDMVSAARVTELNDAYRRGHRLGNVVLTGIVRSIFGNRISDLLSGYRVFSRRFVKSCPALAAGFETETEFCVHALELRMPIGEVLTQYSVRPSGSASKLRTYVDGWRILRMIVVLVKEERPLQFFAVGGIVLLLLGLGFGIPVVTEFMRTGTVPRVPTAVLATGFVVLSFLSFVCGLVLGSVARGRKEIKRLAYLAIPALDVPEGPHGVGVREQRPRSERSLSSPPGRHDAHHSTATAGPAPCGRSGRPRRSRFTAAPSRAPLAASRRLPRRLRPAGAIVNHRKRH